MQTQEMAAGVTFGPYTIQGLIAGGGMGAVYAARHTVYGSAVALKILHADLNEDAGWRQRFSKEGMIGLELKHPHIVSARDVVIDEQGRVALVLDLVQEGKTLLKVMSRWYPDGLPLVQALQVLLGIVQAVEYAHEKGVTHGDIKPENVLIHGDFRDPRTWVPKLTDFGTVGIIAHPVTIDGQPAVVVSPRYASPEHVYGMDYLEPRSDIYCLGLLLHYLLTGQHASNAASVAQAADTVAKPVPVGLLVDQPDSIIKIFQRATQVKPDDRYGSCRELALSIREALDAIGAELELDDLQADLVTEIMEERRRAKRKLLDQEAEGSELDRLEPQVTGETVVAPDPEEEDTSVPAPAIDPATLAADEEDTADHVSPFTDPNWKNGEDRSHLSTEVPTEREYQPQDLGTPAPVDGRASAEEPLSTAVWVSMVVALVVFAAILTMNL